MRRLLCGVLRYHGFSVYSYSGPSVPKGLCSKVADFTPCVAMDMRHAWSDADDSRLDGSICFHDMPCSRRLGVKRTHGQNRGIGQRDTLS